MLQYNILVPGATLVQLGVVSLRPTRERHRHRWDNRAVLDRRRSYWQCGTLFLTIRLVLYVHAYFVRIQDFTSSYTKLKILLILIFGDWA